MEREELEVENEFLKRKLKQLETDIMVLRKKKHNRSHYVYCSKCRKKLGEHKGKECNRGW